MRQITLYKPNGKEITVNDKFDSVEIMLKDGWRLEPEDKPKRAPRRKKVKDDAGT